MFFRREKPIVHTFSNRLSDLNGAGFQTQTESNGRTLVTRKGVGAELAIHQHAGMADIDHVVFG